MALPTGTRQRGRRPVSRAREQDVAPAPDAATHEKARHPESGYEADGSLVGMMGIQRVRDVEPGSQGHGVGSALLEHLQRLSRQRMLVGTWAAAEWAIRFYRHHGFQLVAPERTATLLKAYWTIPDRQIATSVVLANPPFAED